MKKKYSILLLAVLLVSCSTRKPTVIEYHSERLCSGIKNMTEYVINSSEVKNYFIENSSNSEELNCEIDSLVTEGIRFPFLQYEVANIVKDEEKISFEQAYKRLEVKFLSKPKTILNSVCKKQTNISKPQFKIEFYYYPEYALLTAEILKIKCAQEYGKGYIILATLDLRGEIKIMKTSFWEE